MNEQLVGSEIHGFHTLRDLDVASMMEEAKTRWLRPNEIHAILCNYKYFSINAKPVQLPKSGTLVLFDRKMLRNFRKDGHNWKKKKDGKTIKEAHEHLKVGNDERIHVYYAHGEDNATFVRRCYWLLDKTLEHIVLVHYRETKEVQDSPVTPMNLSSISDQLPSFILSEEFDSGMGRTCYAGGKELQGPSDNLTVQNYEMRLHELNTLEWDELVVTNDSQEVSKGDKSSCFNQQSQVSANRAMNTGSSLLAHDLPAQVSSVGNLTDPVARNYNACFSMPNVVPCQSVVNSTLHSNDSNSLASGDNTSIFASEKLQNQDSFGKWMNYIMADSPGSVDDSVLESSISSNHEPQTVSENIFNLTDVSPAWAFSTEKTKILVTGLFREDYLHLAESKLFCVCGDACVPVECVHIGVYRCLLAPHSPGLVHFYMSLDGHKPISQVLTFEYRSPQLLEPIALSNDMSQWDEFKVQTRLAYLLFSTSKSLNILSSKVSPTALKEATKFSQKTAHISDTWSYLIESIESDKISIPKAKDNLFELALRNRLKEWLLERVLAGSKTTEFDGQGQGVIHLCAILGYTWAVYLFSWAGLSLDFRDKHGWTALHWAAYCGREKMVAVLLSAGAKPNLVTDPTSENPDGCIAADLASRRGYEGLAAFLSEQALVKHFEDMSIAGNISGSLQTDSSEVVSPLNATEDEMYLKETLAAYRSAAEAAARIQAALREHSLKVRTNAVRFSNPEEEAQNIIAAMKIQHAFRNYETKKKMVAAARIQHRFRTWKIRKEFLNMRRHAIRIQAIFRGFQVRRQYRKIMWSVGVLEKAVLRWRLKRKGFRGLQVARVDIEPVKDERQESDGEEDFYKASRKQAEQRVERAVVRVQAMFRSKKAQEEYRRMKLATNEAKLEFEGLCDPAYFMKG